MGFSVSTKMSFWWDGGRLKARVYYKARERAELRRVRIHDLGHAYATTRIPAGHRITAGSRQVGHAPIKFTADIYFHWLPNQGFRIPRPRGVIPDFNLTVVSIHLIVLFI